MKTCLIVDDSAVVRSVMARIITQIGLKPVELENGQEAADYCIHYAMPDCILLDLYMPVMNGMDALAAIRTMRDGDEPYIIFVTTESDQAIISQAIDLGANEFITKPFDYGMIKATLEACGILDL